MQTIERSIEVQAPLNEVYNQWTQFEEFPKFMSGVEEVRQISENRLFWRAKFWGQREQWEAEIYEQIPDQRIAWKSVIGAPNAGVVEFEALVPDRTRVVLSMSYQPLGMAEQIADALGVISRRIEGDLRKFREFIEERGRSTGGWRGQIRHG